MEYCCWIVAENGERVDCWDLSFKDGVLLLRMASLGFKTGSV